jgi:hypothetical protein
MVREPGRDDRARAGRILSGLAADVAAGKVQAQEGPTNAMRSALQARESLTEDELVKTAITTMAEWRAKRAAKDQEAKEQKSAWLGRPAARAVKIC